MPFAAGSLVAAQRRRVTKAATHVRSSIIHVAADSVYPATWMLRMREAFAGDVGRRSNWGILPHQAKVREMYGHKYVQILVAVLILGNFIVSATEAEVHREVTEGSVGETVFFALEVFFNVAFAFELLVNMYAYFFLIFWKSAWNVFDFFIVCISLVSMFMKNLPGIGVLRLFRAFRVFRLFKRIKSLRVIIEAVVKSVPGVLNSFAILALIMAIWAIMSVEFFAERRKDEFGNFSKAMLTFFQIMTLDGWCSGIMRPLMCRGEQCEETDIMTIFFFMSYVLINSVMMANVVVAILLDKFIQEMEALAKEEKRAAAEMQTQQAQQAQEAQEASDKKHTPCAPSTSVVFTTELPEAEAQEFTESIIGQLPGAVETSPAKHQEGMAVQPDPDGEAKYQLLRFEAQARQRLREITAELTQARDRLAALARDCPVSKPTSNTAAMTLQLRATACAEEGEKRQPPSFLLPPVHDSHELASGTLTPSASHCVGGA